MRKVVFALLISAVLLLGFTLDVRAEKPWGVTLFYGELTETHFEEIFYTRSQLEERFMLSGMLRRELGSVREVIDWAPKRFFVDAEGGLAHKWGDWKGIDQRFQEVVLSANLRYDPGANPLGLSGISFGNGLSYATKKPEYEKEITLNDQTSRLLYYMMVEMAFHLPSLSHWELVFRVHHRSGFYGLIDGVRGGSNYLGFGLRYNFASF